MKRHAFTVVGLFVSAAILIPAASTLAERERPLTQQLAELKQQRLKTAQRVYSDYRAAFEAETISDDTLIGAMRKLVDAERAVATSPQAELNVLKGHVARVKELYTKVYPPRAPESGERYTYPTVRLELETAEIAVLEFRLRAKL